MKTILNILNSEKFRYLIIGGLTTLVNLICFHVLTEMMDCEVTFSNVISIIAAIIFAFFANKYIVFKSVTEGFVGLIKEFSKFIGGRLITMGVEVGGVFLLYNILNISPMISKIITQFIVVILNYFISKLFVFSNVKS